ncbi:MAG TPA: rhomboid family intramembrane serine protease [Actinocrinis sp.]|nr:rhomboid family intramembrane serine protease [Actinocrinis sp.]
MSTHNAELYACAAVVVGSGWQVVAALAPVTSRPYTAAGPVNPVRGVIAAWARKPVVTAAVLAVTVVMVVLQYAVPGLQADLMREPDALHDGQWWRMFTALFIQSSGLVQIAINLPALFAVGAIAEWVIGPWRWLVVYFGSGLAANYASLLGWSPHGGGSSVAICGLVGALVMLCAIWGSSSVTIPPQIRFTGLLVPVAGVFLCCIRNNHGVGLVCGSVLGLVIAFLSRPSSLHIGQGPVLSSTSRRASHSPDFSDSDEP